MIQLLQGRIIPCVSTPAEARLVVDFLKMAGADFIKTYVDGPSEYFALAAEARRVGLPFGGHLPDGVTGLQASDSGAHFLDHETYFNPDVCGVPSHQKEANVEKCKAAALELRRHDTWVVHTSGGPSQFLFPALAYDQWRRYIPDSLSTERDQRLASLQAESNFTRTPPTSIADWVAASRSDSTSTIVSGIKINDGQWVNREAAGLPILAGTDNAFAPSILFIMGLPGFSLHDCLVAFVLGGMTPLGALQAATLNPALALHGIDSLGTVAAGKLADLVLLDADPLVDIWNTTKIRAVVANGRYFDRLALDQLLAQAEQAAHRGRR